MTPDAIGSLEQAVSGIRQEHHLPDNWSGELEVVADTDELAEDIEDDLFGDDAAELEASPMPPDSILPDLPNVEGKLRGWTCQTTMLIAISLARQIG